MQQKLFKKAGVEASLLGFGCMRFPTTPEGKIDRVKSQEMIDYAYQHGVNYFDTAYRYHEGESEEFVKEALSKYPRETYHIATKFPMGFMPEVSEAAVDRIFDEQLEKTGAGYFDFYLVHGLNAANFQLMKDLKVLEKLEKRKAAGQIRLLGFSFHDTPDVLQEIVDYYDKWEFAQIQLNYLDWTFQNAKEQYEILTNADIPVVVMEPVRGGAFADLAPEANALLKKHRPDDSIASWAMRYCGSLDNVHVILSGMTELYQVEDNVKTFTNFEPLTEEESALLNEALEMRKTAFSVPCTACRYCTEYCPMEINIPEVFAMYNRFKVTGSSYAFRDEVKGMEQKNLPENCIGCGACAAHCPQKIDIPERMKEIDEAIKAL